VSRPSIIERRTIWCECGERKHPCKEACRRCLAMDGATIVAAEVINYLRGVGAATRGEIEAFIYGVSFATGSMTSVQRTLKKLEQHKRVARRVGEDELLRFTLTGRV